MPRRSPVPADPKLPDAQVRITDFAGMSPGTDMHDNDPGLSYFQVNVVPFHPGELRVRRGYRVVEFEAPSPPQPLFRPVAVAGMVILHSDARVARDFAARAFSHVLCSDVGEALPRGRSFVVLTASADAEVA